MPAIPATNSSMNFLVFHLSGGFEAMLDTPDMLEVAFESPTLPGVVHC